VVGVDERYRPALFHHLDRELSLRIEAAVLGFQRSGRAERAHFGHTPTLAQILNVQKWRLLALPFLSYRTSTVTTKN
jgi:hypothetical protein